MTPRLSLVVPALLAAVMLPACADDAKTNVFGDPFLQLTAGIADCPVPPGPELTEGQAREQAHGRIERGTTCYLAGRCRLPNSYLYDREIIPRVKKAVDFAGGYGDSTTVWAVGQRRWVWLKGCVRSASQSEELERMVRGIDDVEAVINELAVQPR